MKKQHYVVRWEIDIFDSSSPKDAAKQALAVIRRKNTVAHVFDVQSWGDVTADEKPSGNITRVDLNKT